VNAEHGEENVQMKPHAYVHRRNRMPMYTEAMHSALLEVKSTVSSIWDKLVGLESKLEKVQNENVKLKQENQKFKSLMHTEYF